MCIHDDDILFGGSQFLNDSKACKYIGLNLRQVNNEIQINQMDCTASWYKIEIDNDKKRDCNSKLDEKKPKWFLIHNRSVRAAYRPNQSRSILWNISSE